MPLLREWVYNWGGIEWWTRLNQDNRINFIVALNSKGWVNFTGWRMSQSIIIKTQILH